MEPLNATVTSKILLYPGTSWKKTL